MNVEFWIRPGKIIVLNQIHVEDLAFAADEKAANRIFDQLLPSGQPRVQPFWRGHIWSECIRWVGSGISHGRRQTSNFAPFATVTRTDEEKAKDELKDLEAGINLGKVRKVQGYYTGRTYPVYNR